MKAQDELVVHEVTLNGGASLAEEAFLGRGEGSHFVSRVSELVLLKPSRGGVANLLAKVEQLVGKGFHNLIVSLEDLGELEADAQQVLMEVQAYLANWAGTLRLCHANAQVRHKLSVLGVADGLALHPDRATAVEDYRQALAAEPPLDPGESADLLDSGDTSDANDWGWTPPAASDDRGAGLPPVEVAEVFCEDDALPRLDTDLRKVVHGGKRFVSLRLHLERPMRSDDVDVLTGCRDYLAREGGQLALVALPKEILRWLEMLEFDREFLIVETAEEAELAHRRRAAGEDPAAATPSPPRAAPAARAALLEAVAREAAPSEAPTSEPLSLEPISSVEFDSDVGLGHSDVGLGHAGAPGASSAELAGLRGQVERLERELGALRDRVRGTEGERDQALRQAHELQGALRREEHRLGELEQAKAQALREAAQAAAAQRGASASVAKLEEELERLRQDLTQSRAAQAAGGEASSGRIRELEAAVVEREEAVALLNAELADARAQAASNAAAPTGGQATGDAAELQRRVAQLEEEKARILTEAEQEIERLGEEHRMLREELESAGEMLERLGKELELS